MGSILDVDDCDAEWRIARVPVADIVDNGVAPEPERLLERLDYIRNAPALERPI